MKPIDHLIEQLDAAYKKNLIKNYFIDIVPPIYISVALHDYLPTEAPVMKLRESLVNHIQSNYTNIRIETCRLRYNVMWIYCNNLLPEDVEIIKQKKLE